MAKESKTLLEKVRLDAIKLKKEGKKTKKKEDKSVKESKILDNPFEEKDKFNSSFVDIPASSLPSDTPARLEEITSASATETAATAGKDEIPARGYSGRQSRYASSRETGVRNLPQYSPTKTTEAFRTAEANFPSTNTPAPLRALQRAQFQDSSVRRFELGDRTSEYYSQQEQPKFAREDFDNPHVQSAARGKRDVDLREYEI